MKRNGMLPLSRYKPTSQHVPRHRLGYGNRLYGAGCTSYSRRRGQRQHPHLPVGEPRFKTNRQQKAYIGIQKLQQSYVTDNILEELSAATTKLTETEQQVKTARENITLAEENLGLVTFSYNEGKSQHGRCVVRTTLVDAGTHQPD